jgi:thiaminase/transcriptional activator TenA
MTSFCDRAWQRTTELRAAIDGLPFNRELAAGTLDQAKFQFYITQDALYLDQYARILVMAGARGPDGATLRLFGECALEAVAVEQALHGQYLAKFGAAGVERSPDCLSYTSFLLATAYHEPWEVLMAAILPCFWIYWDVGNSIAREAAADNKYRAWIDTYSDEGFGNAVRTVIAATDKAAEGTTETVRARMMTAFVRSSRYEYLFWDGAYQIRGWPAEDQSSL